MIRSLGLVALGTFFFLGSVTEARAEGPDARLPVHVAPAVRVAPAAPRLRPIAIPQARAAATPKTPTLRTATVPGGEAKSLATLAGVFVPGHTVGTGVGNTFEMDRVYVPGPSQNAPDQTQLVVTYHDNTSYMGAGAKTMKVWVQVNQSTTRITADRSRVVEPGQSDTFAEVTLSRGADGAFRGAVGNGGVPATIVQHDGPLFPGGPTREAVSSVKVAFQSANGQWDSDNGKNYDALPVAR